MTRGSRGPDSGAWPDGWAAPPRAALEASPDVVAPRLLGGFLLRRAPEGDVLLRLTEVEAYGGADDPGSHGYRGRTPRNATMFGEAGHLYVYFTYGMHHCANVVTGPPGLASAVLLRAGEVVAGAPVAAARRRQPADGHALARGPARLTVALALDRGQDAVDLLDPDGEVLLLLGPPPAPEQVVVSARTGVGGAGAPTPWRFHLRGERSVSPYRAAATGPRRRTRPPAGA